MTTYDLIDEAVIDAPASAVWEALIAELHGARKWWVPSNTFDVVSGSADQVGGRIAVTVHTKGSDKGGLKLRFTSRTVAVEPGRRLEVEYVDGVFRGRSVFRLEPLAEDRTRISMHFVGTPSGFLKILSKVADLGAEHSKGALSAFESLGRRLAPAGAGARG
ncbi:SRPBCC family protein [Streptomyces sp. NPDC006529]|uniref:SRPBCC family protein n=1 Tax=Streptomyces sp. NPDC006529 TaxID=3157177 RepID=UPI0033AE2050